MNLRLLFLSLFSGFGLFSPIAANSFEELSEHLELDGVFAGFIDFEGDGTLIGQQLNEIYTAVLQASPDLPPIPIDFVQTIDKLGFGSLKSVGASSKRLNPELYSNRFVAVYNTAPQGLFALGVDPAGEHGFFTAATRVPSDANAAVTGSINLNALRQVVLEIMTQVMGPTGEAMVVQQTSETVFGTELTFDALIDYLSGKVDIGWKQDFGPDFEPDIALWASFANAGPILAKLQPLSQIFPIEFHEDGRGLTADLSAFFDGAPFPFNLYFFNPAGSTSLEVFSDPQWTVRRVGGSLADTPNFQNLVKRLPQRALAFS